MKFLVISLTFDRSYTLWIVTNQTRCFYDISAGSPKKKKKELVCSIDETWLPVVVDGQTDEQKIMNELKSKFLFLIDSDLPNHRCNKRFVVCFRSKDGKHTRINVGWYEWQTYCFQLWRNARKNFRVQRRVTRRRHLKSPRRTNWHWQPRSTRARTHSTFPHSFHLLSNYRYLSPPHLTALYLVLFVNVYTALPFETALPYTHTHTQTSESRFNSDFDVCTRVTCIIKSLKNAGRQSDSLHKTCLNSWKHVNF